MLSENGVTFEMLLEFTEEDVKDVFPKFSDRFQVRKFLSMRKEYKTPIYADDSEGTVHESEQELDSSIVSESDISVIDESKISTANRFTADEMLERKIKRGKPTPAQLFFRNLLRDAAVSANVWKRAPPLAEISDNKKVLFFAAFEVSPQLLRHKKDLWKRLGESLQNRRKYLLDKQMGKRS